MAPVATKLTQSPWFLNPGKFFQPPFLHWSLVVGTDGESTMVICPLTTSEAELDDGLRAWEDALAVVLG